MSLLPSTYPVTCHTDNVGQGSVFFALKGAQNNGIDLIAIALQKGAKTIVVDTTQQHSFQQICCCGPLLTDYCVTCNVRYEYCNHALLELGPRAASALNFPAKKIKIIGITGTKGKTTTAYLTYHFLKSAGHKTALLGTIANFIGDKQETSSLTTPTADYLQMFLAQCVIQNVAFVVMEVSSISLELGRVAELTFTVAAFTNFAQDHLDLHGTMELYFAAKLKLFNQMAPHGIALFNVQEAWTERAFTSCTTPKQKIEFTLLNSSLDGVALRLPKNIVLACPALIGAFNAENLAVAASIAQHCGVNQKELKQAALTFVGVPGRLQKHTLRNGAIAFVDYAHNPSSFEAVLATLRPLTTHLIVLFGCGGNRDHTKRAIMGRIASQYGNVIIITNDNPRYEDQNAIIADIMQGIDPTKNIVIELDRHQAIAQAAALATPTSIIALLGKGHEPYFLIQGEKLYFDDAVEIQKF